MRSGTSSGDLFWHGSGANAKGGSGARRRMWDRAKALQMLRSRRMFIAPAEDARTIEREALRCDHAPRTQSSARRWLFECRAPKCLYGSSSSARRWRGGGRCCRTAGPNHQRAARTVERATAINPLTMLAPASHKARLPTTTPPMKSQGLGAAVAFHRRMVCAEGCRGPTFGGVAKTLPPSGLTTACMVGAATQHRSPPRGRCRRAGRRRPAGAVTPPSGAKQGAPKGKRWSRSRLARDAFARGSVPAQRQPTKETHQQAARRWPMHYLRHPT